MTHAIYIVVYIILWVKKVIWSFLRIVPFSMLLLTSVHKLLYILPKTNTITSLNGCWWLMACHKNDKIYDSLSYEIRILIFVGLYIYILLVVLCFGMYMWGHMCMSVHVYVGGSCGKRRNPLRTPTRSTLWERSADITK